MAEKTSLINIGRAELDDNKTVWQVQQEYRKVWKNSLRASERMLFLLGTCDEYILGWIRINLMQMYIMALTCNKGYIISPVWKNI